MQSESSPLSDGHIWRRNSPPLPVQILLIIFYGGFAIAVSITAMAMFGLIGLILAGFMAWQWARLPVFGGSTTVAEDVDAVRPDLTDTPLPSSGNASFDGYRAELLSRLEKEQQLFDDFLTRLRDAKDQSEFDQFMADRADRVADHPNTPPAPA